MSLMYKHEEYPSLHDRAIAADIGGKQPVRDWLDELIEKLPLPSKGRDFTEREIFEANIKVAQDWFGPGVKTDELVAGVVAGFGWLSRPLALTGEFLAKNPILCSVVGALGIAGAGMIADVDHSHAMGHEIGISVGETHLELPSDGLSVFYGDNMAIIGNTQDGVMTGLFMAPGLTMIDGQPMLGDNQREQGYRPAFDLQSGNVAIDHVDDGDKPPFDRYTITFDAGDWQAARILVMRSGQRNNSQMMLNRLEEVAGYGSTGQLFVDVTPDFSGQNAEVKIWGIGQTGEDGKAQIIDLGTKHVSQFDVFPTSQVKEAVLVPVSNGSETVIMVMPTNLTNPEIGEDGVWQATDSTGKHYELVDGAWVEAETTLTPDQLALMSADEKLAAAPEMEGREKELRGAHVYYSDAEGNETHLFDLRTLELVRVFPVCGLSEGQKCSFDVMGDLSEFAEFVQTQLTAEMFDPDKINWVDKFDALPFGAETILVPDYTTAPHYTQPGSAPFIRDEFTGRWQVSPTEQAFVVGVPQFIPGLPPEQWPVMVGVRSREGFSKVTQAAVDTFQDDMNIVAWRVDAESIDFATQFVNPATGESFTQSEVISIIEEMKQGDFSHTHGLTLLMRIAKTVSGIEVLK